MDRPHLRAGGRVAAVAAGLIAAAGLIGSPAVVSSENTRFDTDSNGGNIKPEFWPVVVLPEQGYPPPYHISRDLQSPYIGMRDIHFFSIKAQNALGVVVTFDRGLVGRVNRDDAMSLKELNFPVDPLGTGKQEMSPRKIDEEVRKEIINKMLIGVSERAVFDINTDTYLAEVFPDVVPYITNVLQIREGALTDRFGTDSHEALLRTRIQQYRISDPVNP